MTVALERSRSGQGGHAWIFFSEPVSASVARKLGVILLAKASALRPTMGLDEFDRFFPNQDVVSVGGFGNLIALPLAKEPETTAIPHFSMKNFVRYWTNGNTWLSSSGCRPCSCRTSWEGWRRWHRWSRPHRKASISRCRPTKLRWIWHALVRPGMLTEELAIRLDSKIHIPRSIPVPLLAALRRLASFANPVFHEKLRLRFPTFDTLRFLFAGEWHADRLILPRGVLEPCLQILEGASAAVSVQDQREEGARIGWKFHGELRPEQQTEGNGRT